MGTSGDGLGEAAEAQRRAGAGDGLMKKRGIARAEHFIKKSPGLTPHRAGNAAHRAMLPSQQEKEMAKTRLLKEAMTQADRRWYCSNTSSFPEDLKASHLSPLEGAVSPMMWDSGAPSLSRF